MVHAGLLPEWSVARARRLAAEVEYALQGPRFRELLERMYGDRPDRWVEEWRKFPGKAQIALPAELGGAEAVRMEEQ